jgi:hypothetical protein
MLSPWLYHFTVRCECWKPNRRACVSKWFICALKKVLRRKSKLCLLFCSANTTDGAASWTFRVGCRQEERGRCGGGFFPIELKVLIITYYIITYNCYINYYLKVTRKFMGLTFNFISGRKESVLYLWVSLSHPWPPSHFLICYYILESKLDLINYNFYKSFLFLLSIL